MNCCDTLAKILLIVFNAVFLVCGLAILGVGIWIKLDPVFSNLGKAVHVGSDEAIVEIVTWTFIGVGIFVFAIAFAGLIGTIRESKVIMGFYIVCVFIVFAAEASAGIYAGVRQEYLIDRIKNDAAQQLKTVYSQDADSYVSQGFNYVQQEWKCCGVRNFMDYTNSTYLSQLGNKIKANATMSWACCNTTSTVDEAIRGNGELKVTAENREICMIQSILATNEYRSLGEDAAMQTCEMFSVFRCGGCADELERWVEENLVILLGVGVGVGSLQLIIMFLALWFCQSLGKYREKKESNQ